MYASNPWGLRRYATLLVVLTLHMVLLAVLVNTPRSRISSASTSHPIGLVFIAPAKAPENRAQKHHPQRFSGERALSIAPPVLYSQSLPALSSPPASGSDGNESGVDWAAEARRALQAFEIRSHQSTGTNWVSGASNEDPGWPRVRHRAGEQFKTANGDWIVWINSSCYQLASSTAPAPGATLPPTVCTGH